jgi:hypothetical protein
VARGAAGGISQRLPNDGNPERGVCVGSGARDSYALAFKLLFVHCRAFLMRCKSVSRHTGLQNVLPREEVSKLLPWGSSFLKTRVT